MTLTNQTQPNRIFQPDDRKNRQPDPQPGLSVERQPEKPLIGQILRGGAVVAAVLAFENPMRIARGGVHFVPPSEPNEAPTSNIFEVVEIGGQEKNGEDED